MEQTLSGFRPMQPFEPRRARKEVCPEDLPARSPLVRPITLLGAGPVEDDITRLDNQHALIMNEPAPTAHRVDQEPILRAMAAPASVTRIFVKIARNKRCECRGRRFLHFGHLAESYRFTAHYHIPCFTVLV